MQPDSQYLANHGDRRHAVFCVALIALGAFTHYGWALAPPEHQAQIWNGCGALARLALLIAMAWRIRSRVVMLAFAWLACEELMVAGCSAAYVMRPWQIEPGQAQCSALLQFDIGKIGLFIMCVLIWQSVKPDRSEQ